MIRHECPTVAPMRCAAHVQMRGETVCHPDVCVACLKNEIERLNAENRELQRAMAACNDLLGVKAQ